MTHLFDTNAWLRFAEAPTEISASAREVISSQPGPFGLSAISIWELCEKVRRGRLELSVPLEEWLRRTLDPSFVKVIPVDGLIARLATELPGEFHKDPADRFIVATALSQGLTLVTSDEKILAYPHIASLDTR